jgi:CheY-like chemotaxis protein
MGKALILIADDSQTVRLLSQRVLQGAGYQVLVAKDGAEAVALAAENHPQVVILDIQMPVMDGYEACDRILKLADNVSQMRIVFLTCEQGLQLEQLGKQYGAYLPKPFNSDSLLATVKRLLSETVASDQTVSTSQGDECIVKVPMKLCPH